MSIPKKSVIGLLLVALMIQTSCVSMAMSAVYAQEVEDRQKLKAWFAKDAAYAGCATPVTIAPMIYHDFNFDGTDELVVDAASCKAGNAGADIHAVLTPREDGGFIAWQLPEIAADSLKQAALVRNRNYRLSVQDKHLVAIWRNKFAGEKPLLTVRYVPVGGDKYAFTLYDVTYGN